ncbi:MAG TPA: HD domain-containing phosphohydrolase [Treponemataceae bacterium]|nr:HD domain-containing phosphohydrolase [Treponemataceae bacterium]
MKKLLLFIAMLSLFVASSFAQDFQSQARDLYGQGRFQEAFDLVVQTVPEATTKVDQKVAAGDCLTEIGMSEYRRRNFKNAYESFRKALKYAPTNSTATQYYLKIRKEQDVANLRNEAAAAPVAVTGAPAGSEVRIEQGQVTQTTPALGQSASAGDGNLNALIKQLGDAEAQLATLQSSDRAAKRDNELLQAQLDQQKALLQQLRARPSGETASSAQQDAIVKETLKVMNEVSQRLANQEAPQVVVQQPAGQIPQWVLIALLGFIALLFLSVVVAVALVALRARSRRKANAHYSADFTLPLDSQIVGTPSFSTPLLDYRGEPSGVDRSLAAQEPGLKRDLLKADHLNRLSEEVKNGTLSWETVRKYVTEMETDLKASILKIVEVKLEEGDLVANEAVLPILFPFLTDYDSFIREKAETLARVALLPEKGAARDVFDDEPGSPFEVKNLMVIPKQLKAVLKGNDQTLVTAKLARGIAKHMGLSVNDCQDIYKAALAHDAGYLVLDQDRLQSILAKNEISDDEFAFIQGHTTKAPQYFGDVEIPESIREAMYYHHERNDGSGYPEGLKKDEIPTFAKIIGLAETFAALIANRPYREKVDYAQALAIIRDSRSKFDREIIEALTKVVQSSGGYR